ncbi:MAG: hypothetical protein N3F03_07750, partial [Ignavibacteria bacterium]|nr:hypothetical protein [Ignavibacteria bacterium]
MKHLQKILTVLLLFVLILPFNGCKKSSTEPEPAINESEVLVDYLEKSGTQYGYIYDCASFVIDAAQFRTEFLADSTKVHIIDIRAASDYNTKRLRRA